MNRSRLSLLTLTLLLAGCSTSKDALMPPGDTDMKTLWQSRSGGSARLMDARATAPAGDRHPGRRPGRLDTDRRK